MDKSLPKGVFFHHGAIYRVHKNIWYLLGRSYKEAAKRDFWPPQLKGMEERHIRANLAALVARCKTNAGGRRNIDFNLSVDDVAELMERANWACTVTGIKFSEEVTAGRRPFAPSIDRINNALGYSKDNCRVVCAAVNIALNVWGDDVFATIAHAYVRREKRKSLAEALSQQLDNAP